MKFIKAEAAYKNAVSAHFDFVKARNTDDGQTPTQISETEKSTYLDSPLITPVNPNDLTLSQIMCQKYIAQWAWAHLE